MENHAEMLALQGEVMITRGATREGSAPLEHGPTVTSAQLNPT